MKQLKRISLITLSFLLLVTFLPSQELLAAKQTKQTYLSTRFKKTKKKCKRLYDNAFSQYDMNMASLDEFTIWKKELNNVYKKELQRLGKKKAAKLKKEQATWKKGIKKYAIKQSRDYEGGSMYPLIYNSAKSSYVKKRIKQIIKKYGDVGNF